MMKRLRGLVTTTLISTALLSGCATPDPFQSMSDGPCTTKQKELVSTHITDQISALSSGDFKKAYTFAADAFQSSVSLEEFEFILKAQYQVLIQNNQINFGDCSIQAGEVNQLVEAISAKQQVTLNYRLTYIDNRLGINAATAANQIETLTT